MKNNLKNALNEYYSDFHLSEEQMRRLEALTESEKPESNIVRVWLYPAIAGFAAALILSFTFYLNSLKPLDQKIASEVTYNHNKGMPSEVLTDEYSVINEALDRLDFEVKPSQVLAGSLDLAGARYCSVQGKIAAQLKMVDPESGQEFTLYQFKATGMEDLHSMPVQIEDGNVTVRIWREGDLGFAIANTRSKP